MDKFLLQADHIWRVGFKWSHNGYCWVTGPCTIHYMLGLSNILVDFGQYRTSSIKAVHKPYLGCDGQCNLEQCLSSPINKRCDPGLSFQTKDKYAWIRPIPTWHISSLCFQLQELKKWNRDTNMQSEKYIEKFWFLWLNLCFQIQNQTI